MERSAMRAVLFVLLLLFVSRADAQVLTPRDLASAAKVLQNTYSENCKVIRERRFSGLECTLTYGVDAQLPAHGASQYQLVVISGTAQQIDYRSGSVVPTDLIGITVRPTIAVLSAQVKKDFFDLARQVVLPDGSRLADKFPTPESLIRFCRSRSDAVQSEGECNLDETRTLNVLEGLQVDAEKPVFANYFAVRVVRRSER